MNKMIPIETDIGILWGRDAIFLSNIEFDYNRNLVRLKGDLASRYDKDNCQTNYTLEFSGVYIFNMVELDLSFEVLEFDFNESSFLEVKDSNLVKTAKKIRKVDLRHFVVQTYDDVFEVVCKDFTMSLSN